MMDYEEAVLGTGILAVEIKVYNLEPGQEAECERLLRSALSALEDRMIEETR